MARQQLHGGHQKSGSAIAALQAVIFRERFLNWMKLFPDRKAFNGSNLALVRLEREHGARFHRAAIALVPELSNAKILEDWAGLRPGTPDALPILGATTTPGYFVATGHFRDGILLAPITAQVMADLITGVAPAHDLMAFSPSRFEAVTVHS